MTQVIDLNDIKERERRTWSNAATTLEVRDDSPN